MGKKKPSSTLPDWVGKEMVCFVDGPRAGEWAFATHGPNSWSELQRLARFDREPEGTGRTLAYVETNEKHAHRVWTGLLGTVWRWEP